MPLREARAKSKPQRGAISARLCAFPHALREFMPIRAWLIRPDPRKLRENSPAPQKRRAPEAPRNFQGRMGPLRTLLHGPETNSGVRHQGCRVRMALLRNTPTGRAENRHRRACRRDVDRGSALAPPEAWHPWDWRDVW